MKQAELNENYLSKDTPSMCRDCGEPAILCAMIVGGIEPELLLFSWLGYAPNAEYATFCRTHFEGAKARQRQEKTNAI